MQICQSLPINRMTAASFLEESVGIGHHRQAIVPVDCGIANLYANTSIKIV